MINLGTEPLPHPVLTNKYQLNSRFPAPFRAFVQAGLTFFWEYKAPILQPVSPASLVARTLQTVLGTSIADYTFVDFCSGAGGPTPFIEQEVNKAFKKLSDGGNILVRNEDTGANGHMNGSGDGGRGGGVDFVMTDIHPHLPEWVKASKKSKNLHYVPSPVDAANAPHDLLSMAGTQEKNKKIFRLFSLAFHHFPDPLATRILHNTLTHSSGFAIFELQGRDLGSIFTILGMFPLLWAGSWYWFWGDWGLLFWTYVVPVVPFVLVFDGVVSSLRTRREGEVLELIRECGASTEGWRFETGREIHTWTGGTMNYFIGIKESGGKKMQ
ncbi:MAG: hypothetical protein ASARMPREDX12_006717 [Alectoria sarmentosa]|nr:MAG: hypothetical protein ASARMPREDX12_006717 [Alectoria sarmentosa]